jgi:acetyl esterase/lipase
VAILVRATRRRLVLAGAFAVAVIVLWSLRSVLPPPNPWVPAASVVGFLDLVCVGLEVAALAGFAALLVPARPRSRVLRAMLVLPALPLAVAVVVGTGVGVAGTTDAEPTAARTVEYCRPDGVPLSMDLYPPATPAGRAPVALYLHGGGMIYGDRTPTGFGARMSGHVGALFPSLRRELNARGFVVASIDYRLLPATRWPAPVSDASCAVDFLRSNAASLGVDPERIGVWGSSAGGQLACLLGLSPRVRVQAVVVMFGCADLTDLGDSAPGLQLTQWLVGGSPDVRRAASPNGHDARGAPPFLILQGTGDVTIPPRHAVALERQLLAAGVPARLILVNGAGHGLASPTQRPAPEELTRTVADFFSERLTR